MRCGGGGSPERDPGKRLLVLGAGPAQLGLLAAARARGFYVIASTATRPRPGFATRTGGRSSRPRTSQASNVWRRRAVDGLIAPGIDWPVAIAARVAERHGLPHPIDAATAGLAVSNRSNASASRRPVCPSRAGRSSRPPTRLCNKTVRAPGWSRRPTGRVKGSSPCPLRGRAPGRDRARDRKSRSGGHDRGARGRAGGDRQRLRPGEFHPLTVTDR